MRCGIAPNKETKNIYEMAVRPGVHIMPVHLFHAHLNNYLENHYLYINGKAWLHDKVVTLSLMGFTHCLKCHLKSALAYPSNILSKPSKD